jgi:hypothetical protein
MTPLKMLTTDDKVAEIRRLYFQTTKESIQADLEKALDLLKSMPSEEERDRVAVFMDGMAQMRAEWGKGGKGKSSGTSKKGAPRRTKP